MKRQLIVIVASLCMTSSTWSDEGQGGHKMQTGEDLMRMCMAAKVQALSLMCNNYINGYLDAVASGLRKGQFCFGKGDRGQLPMAIAIWLAAHPDYKKKPAPEGLDRVLSEKFSCKK